MLGILQHVGGALERGEEVGRSESRLERAQRPAVHRPVRVERRQLLHRLVEGNECELVVGPACVDPCTRGLHGLLEGALVLHAEGPVDEEDDGLIFAGLDERDLLGGEKRPREGQRQQQKEERPDGH